MYGHLHRPLVDNDLKKNKSNIFVFRLDPGPPSLHYNNTVYIIINNDLMIGGLVYGV